MPDTGEQRVLHATRIPSFDKVIGGGVIPGSTILVLAEPGSGGREFIQTSLVNYCSDSVNRVSPPEGVQHPAEIHCISLACSRDVFEQQMEDLWNTKRDSQFQKMMERVHYTDLGEEIGGDLARLFERINAVPDGSVLFIDSLTVLLPYCTRTPDTWVELVTMMRRVTRSAKKRRTTILFHLTSGILTRGQENELSDTVDVVLNMFWQKNVTVKRQRQMYLLKLDGRMPRIDQRDMVIFNVNITPGTGFEITNMRRGA